MSRRSRDQLWRTTFGERTKGIAEIAFFSVLLIGMAVGMGLAAAFGWSKLANGQSLKWEIAAFVGIVGLLPYLIVAAKVWEVNLSIFGNRASSELPKAGDVASEHQFLRTAGEASNRSQKVLPNE